MVRARFLALVAKSRRILASSDNRGDAIDISFGGFRSTVAPAAALINVNFVTRVPKYTHDRYEALHEADAISSTPRGTPWQSGFHCSGIEMGSSRVHMASTPWEIDAPSELMYPRIIRTPRPSVSGAIINNIESREK